MSSSIEGAEWSAAPALTWGIDNSSNRALSSNPRSSLAGTMNLDFLLRRMEPTYELAMRPRYTMNRFTNDGANDSNDRSLDCSGSWASEYSRLNASAGYSLQSTLDSELTETGVVTDASRKTKSAGVSWSRMHSEHRTLRTQLSYADVEYTGNRAVRLPGYRYPSLSLGEVFTLSERTSVSVTAFGSLLQSPVEGGDSRDSGISFSFDRALNDQTMMHATAGYSTRELAGISDQGYVADFELTRQTELNRWRLYYHHRLTASGLGYLIERDEAGLALSRPINQTLSADFSVRAVRNDNSTLATSGERRRYESAESSLSWRMNETSIVRTSASFSQAKQNELTEEVDGWRVAVSFNWTPRPKVISR